MKVIATQLGIYDGKLRFIDEVFELKEIDGFKQDPKTGKVSSCKYSVESQFSKNWMRKLDGDVTEVSEPLQKKGRVNKSKTESNNHVNI